MTAENFLYFGVAFLVGMIAGALLSKLVGCINDLLDDWAEFRRFKARGMYRPYKDTTRYDEDQDREEDES